MARRWLKQERRTKEELFDALVRNALGFVNSSIDHLQTKPKNAIVDLYTAVELFLKARLMKEHWTLMLSKPETGDLQNLAVGDFLSVYLDDALNRIPSILGEKIDKNASDNFKALGEHRNQIVHFAHSGMDNPSKTQAGVIAEAGLTDSGARSREDESLTAQDRAGLGSRQQAQQGAANSRTPLHAF